MAAAHSTTPVSLTEKQQKRRQKIDKGLAAILEVLNSGAATKVPLVQIGFSSAARIFEISQKVRANQDEFIEFAEECCRLIYDISLKLGDTQEIEAGLKSNLEELVKTLQSIEVFGEKCAARSTVKAVFLFGFDINEIKAQRRKLERCMRLFEFQSLLDLREKTNKLVEQYGTGGGDSNATVNKDNVTDNKISFGNNANFDGANGNVMGSGNVVNHNSNNNYGGGAGHRSTSTVNTNNRVNNSVSFGNGANFSNSSANAFGANNEINVNSNNRTGGNVFGSDNAVNNNSQNRSDRPDSHDNNGNNGNAQNDQRRGAAANVNKSNNSNNVTNNDIKFGDGATFSNTNGNVFGANNQISHNSNNVYDNSSNVHNNGSHNVTVSNWGNNNQAHIGNNNAGNQGIIGGGSNNTVNSGANSGHQFFPNAANFTIAGGEFSAVGGNNIRNNYGVGHIPN